MEKKHVKQGAISVYFTTGIYVFPDNSNICSLKDLITGVFNSSPLSKTVVFFIFFIFGVWFFQVFKTHLLYKLCKFKPYGTKLTIVIEMFNEKMNFCAAPHGPT